MNAQIPQPQLGYKSADFYEKIAEGLINDGYVVLPNALPCELTEALYDHVIHLDDEAFQRAGIGRATDQQVNSDIRRDHIRWLDPQAPAPAAYLGWMEELKLALNRRLFMGLFDYEAHFACYEQGAFYKKHLDAFRGRTNRVLTTVFYLNEDWQADDGGELLIYRQDEEQAFNKVRPEMGTLVVFLSEDFPHEVLPAQRNRFSIAGWFRVNANINNMLDPAR